MVFFLCFSYFTSSLFPQEGLSCFSFHHLLHLVVHLTYPPEDANHWCCWHMHWKSSALHNLGTSDHDHTHVETGNKEPHHHDQNSFLKFLFKIEVLELFLWIKRWNILHLKLFWLLFIWWKLDNCFCQLMSQISNTRKSRHTYR